MDFVVNSDLKNELFTTIANLPKKLEDVEVYLNNILKIIRHFEPGKVEQLDSLLNNIKQNLRESQVSWEDFFSYVLSVENDKSRWFCNISGFEDSNFDLSERDSMCISLYLDVLVKTIVLYRNCK